MIKITQKLKDKLWWMIISVDYDYSRITVADHELNEDVLTLWLEDKHDFKNSLEECLQVDITTKQFARIVRAENMNSYEGTKLHPKKNFIYKARIEINEPIKWYKEDASLIEQQWAREAVVKLLLTELVENEVADIEVW
ncbi:hypothetical protein [Mucilaginibacter sp.]|uniref:hypothetical protein n=1 Tax=Mucilaginibacter sp. TaxID=1882438 RepID=UPI00261A0205|nr:hypothetical protein [Mucilaginibacter sp.]MDB4926792.1 hypothetical protein [Mucilaginibacter sp.]